MQTGEICSREDLALRIQGIWMIDAVMPSPQKHKGFSPKRCGEVGSSSVVAENKFRRSDQRGQLPQIAFPAQIDALA